MYECFESIVMIDREKYAFQNPYFFILLQNKKTDTFVSVFYSGRGDRIRTCGILVPNEPIRAISAKNNFFRPFPLGKLCSSPLLCPLFPSAPKR